MPTIIVSDKDAIFTSNFWLELFRLQGTELAMSTAYPPRLMAKLRWLTEVWSNI